jgi:sugar/nucleoside kinase (ribokinase family)
MSVDVLCIGHAAYDLSAFVDGYPEENTKCEIQALLECGGGPAANAAYLLSLWGLRTAFAGLIGYDRYGERIRQEFESVGTDLTWMEMRPGHATPVSLILINKQNGSRTIVNRKDPNATLFIPPSAFAGLAPKVLLFDGHEPAASLAALEAFPDAISILDAGSWREGTALLAGKIHYLAASERFAQQVTGLTTIDSEATERACLAKLREQFPTKVIVTLGERGLISDDGSGYQRLAAFPARAVDTTGAGDIFHGALAYALATDMPLADGLRLASMTAALSVQIPGGRNSIPPLNRAEEALLNVG